MKKTPYQKPDLQIIEIETEEVIATSPGNGSGIPGGEDNNVPETNTKARQYLNTWGNENQWNEAGQ